MSARKRARDLGVPLGKYEPGPHNAITDVEGVKVGHATLVDGEAGPIVPGVGPVRTGVTAILPYRGDVFHERVVGGGFVLNGAGEVSGLTQVMEWGLIETPIFLTNTLSVGSVSAAAVQYMVEHYPGIGQHHDVIIPLVGECDDSFLNDIAGQHVTEKEVYDAIDAARSGRVPEGNVGGGTGMITCDLKGGIGTSSRHLPPALGSYTLGVLVMSNFGVLEDFRVGGFRLGPRLVSLFENVEKRRHNYGSIIAVLATDAPLLSQQISRLCRRVGLGIGRAGSYAGHGSGEIVVGFSTANRIPRETRTMVHDVTMLLDVHVDPLYDAAVECTEEAILNAVCMAETMSGAGGNTSPAVPLDEIEKIVPLLRGLG
jgi:D-aminopeptidase